MLLMLAALVAPVGIEATWMEPQLRAIRSLAAKRGWSVTCEGHAGEEGVVRLRPPAGTDENGMKAFADDTLKIASSVQDISPQEAAAKMCDGKAMSDGDVAPQRALAFGPATQLGSLQAIARACGYQHTYVRLRTAADDNVFFAWSLPPSTHTLDSGEDAPSRYGPRVCFMNMGIVPLGLLP